MRTLTRAAISHAPPSGMDGFVNVSRGDMNDAEALYYAHSIIQGSFEITVNALLSGGVVLRHPVLPREDVDRAWYSETWGRFLRDMLQCFWIYGFAVCTADPDDVYTAVPRVVPMDLVRTEIHYSDTGRRTYRCSRARAVVSTLDSMDVLHGVLDNVWVYELDPPTVAGAINSKVLQLKHDAAFYEHINQTYVEAMVRRANVPLVLQTLPDSYDSANIRTAESEPHTSALEAIARKPSEAEALAQMRIQHVARLHNAGLNPDMVYGVDVKTSKTSTGQNVFHLPRDRQLVNPVLCDPPGVLVDMRMDFVMRVGVKFQVPLAALFGKQQGSSLAFTNNGERAMAMDLFAEQQKRYKHMFIAIMRDVFIESYAIQLAAMAVVTTEKEDGVEPEGVVETVLETKDASSEEEVDLKHKQRRAKVAKNADTLMDKLIVAMPGQPPLEDVVRMYGMGLLTWAALRTYIGTSQFIPESMMNTEPKLDSVQAAAVSVNTAPREMPAPTKKPPAKKAKR